jgi:hypothetical protein
MARNRGSDSCLVRTQSLNTPSVSNENADDVALHFCETRPSIQQYQCLTTRIQVASVEDQPRLIGRWGCRFGATLSRAFLANQLFTFENFANLFKLRADIRLREPGLCSSLYLRLPAPVRLIPLTQVTPYSRYRSPRGLPVAPDAQITFAGYLRTTARIGRR